jgi:hypothetical protein
MTQTSDESIAKFIAWTAVRDRDEKFARSRADEENQRRANQVEAEWKAAREAMEKALDQYEPPELTEPDDGIVDVLRHEIASLKALVHERDGTIALLRDQLELSERKREKPQLKFYQTLNDVADRIVKLRADLFHNAVARKGASKFKVKLFVWLDNKDGEAGNIKPLIFPLKYHPKSQEMDGDLVWKGAAYKQYGIKGAVHVPDHLCLVWHDECRLTIGQREIDIDEYRWVRPEPGKLLPIKRWYWNAE